jgi:CHAT domain-containing protein
MTKNDFQELKKQKNEKFSFQIIAKNGNNKCLTQEMDSEILGYEVSSDHQTSLQIWVIPVISVILIIVLTVTSVLVYRCIILKRRNLINLTELIEHRELHQVFSVEGRYYK